MGSADPVRAVPRAMQRAVLAWFAEAGRPLAFRRTRDPYAILVSELMAQQTQIARASEAWVAWMARFPTVEALATAPVADAIRQWSGLGYNRRAVNLHRAAVAIMGRHGGQVPSTIDDLVALPGVGPYTARAMASIAFGAHVGAVDVNVRRVLGRVLVGDAEGLSRRELQAVADRSVPSGAAGAWTHALMDIGAGFCRPRPRCAPCPALRWCAHARAPRDVRGRLAGPSGSRTFHSTNRWLRGRIVERLRDAEGWSTFDSAIGVHDLAAVSAGVHGLARDGLAEIDTVGGTLRARLPSA